MADLGLKYNKVDGFPNYTSSQAKLLARVKVERWPLKPATEVGIVATGDRGASPKLIDEKGARAYVANFYAKALERIWIPEVEGWSSAPLSTV